VGNLVPSGMALLAAAGIVVGLTRVVVVWLALRGTHPEERPAILRAVAVLFSARFANRVDRLDSDGPRRANHSNRAKVPLRRAVGEHPWT
jgi:hypothetical protein